MGIDFKKIDERAGAITSDANALKGRGKMPAQHERGTTLVEVAVAGALLALALANLFALYGTTVKEAKDGDTAAIAQQNCIARIDQIRNLTWNSITDPSDPSFFANPKNPNNLLTNLTSSDNASTISREVISIYPAAVPQTSPLPAPIPPPSPTPGSTPFFSVIRPSPTPPSNPTPTPSSILGESLIRVEVMTEWGAPKTTHQRYLSTLISRSGTKTQ